MHTRHWQWTSQHLLCMHNNIMLSSSVLCIQGNTILSSPVSCIQGNTILSSNVFCIQGIALLLLDPTLIIFKFKPYAHSSLFCLYQCDPHGFKKVIFLFPKLYQTLSFSPLDYISAGQPVGSTGQPYLAKIVPYWTLIIYFYIIIKRVVWGFLFHKFSSLSLMPLLRALWFLLILTPCHT